MIERRRWTSAPPPAVWGVLTDPWAYPAFVVGASAMRAVDDAWPAVDSRLHHSVGAWPLLLHDTTSVRAIEPPRRLELVARGWPAGEAVVAFTLEPSGGGTAVTLAEDASRGPGRFVPAALRSALLRHRNDETLRRLDALARGRARTARRSDGSPGR